MRLIPFTVGFCDCEPGAVAPVAPLLFGVLSTAGSFHCQWPALPRAGEQCGVSVPANTEEESPAAGTMCPFCSGEKPLERVNPSWHTEVRFPRVPGWGCQQQ